MCAMLRILGKMLENLSRVQRDLAEELLRRLTQELWTKKYGAEIEVLKTKIQHISRIYDEFVRTCIEPSSAGTDVLENCISRARELKQAFDDASSFVGTLIEVLEAVKNPGRYLNSLDRTEAFEA